MCALFNPEILQARTVKGMHTSTKFITSHDKLIQYNITLLPSVNTLIARGMFCGAKYTHHTVTPIIKHLITTTETTTTTTTKSW